MLSAIPERDIATDPDYHPQHRPLKRPRDWVAIDEDSPPYPSSFTSPLHPANGYHSYPATTRDPTSIHSNAHGFSGGYDPTTVCGAPAMTSPVQQSSSQQRSSLVEKEKGRRLSCKECRRLKLKCDRVFPCHSCRKRGCSDICPDGTLTSGRGSRFILANTEQLHDKILQLSDRVRQLEDGLRDLQNTVSPDTHPLLTPELLQIRKISQEFYAVPAPAQSPIALTQPYRYPPLEKEDALSGSQAESPPPEVPQDLIQLSTNFPYPWTIDANTRKRIRDALPSREETISICNAARINALWQYNFDTSDTFLQNLVDHCYTSTIEDLRPRKLALLLMILAIGSAVDLTKPSFQPAYSEAFHHLARAAISERPLVDEPDFDLLHSLIFMVWYYLIFCDNNKSVGYAWSIIGFVIKTAQGLGMHRETQTMKLIPEEDEKRRLVFWELLNLDCRLSLSLGRPPSISLSHVDIKRPSYTSSISGSSEEQIIYHQWKNSFLIECLSPILETMTAVHSPKYITTLQLDKKVRDFPVPPLLEDQRPGSSPYLHMQMALVSMAKDIALLQLHRRHFKTFVNNQAPISVTDEHCPSVIAIYISANSVISAIENLYAKEQQLSTRFLCFWFNAYSVTVTLSLMLSRLFCLNLAALIIHAIERTCVLFRNVASMLPFAKKALPILEKVAEKSKRSFMQRHGDPNEYLRNINGITYTAPNETLPPTFIECHDIIKGFSTRMIELTDKSTLPEMIDSRVQASRSNSDVWLPNIFRANGKVNGDNGHIDQVDSESESSPFGPRVSRAAQDVNFDYGALSADIDDTSYMAWF